MPLATATLSSFGPSFSLSIAFCAAIVLRTQNNDFTFLAHEIAGLNGEFVDRLRLFASLLQKLFERLVIVENRNNDLCLKFDREFLRFGRIQGAFATDGNNEYVRCIHFEHIWRQVEITERAEIEKRETVECNRIHGIRPRLAVVF